MPGRSSRRAERKVVERHTAVPSRANFCLVPPIREAAAAEVQDRVELVVPDPGGELSRRLGGSEDASGIDDSQISLEPRPPEDATQAQGDQNEQDRRRSGRVPMRSCRDTGFVRRSSGGKARSVPRAFPFRYNRGANQKSPRTSTTITPQTPARRRPSRKSEIRASKTWLVNEIRPAPPPVWGKGRPVESFGPYRRLAEASRRRSPVPGQTISLRAPGGAGEGSSYLPCRPRP